MKSFQIELYSEKYFHKWENFIKNSRNGTIFHSRSFLSYHPKDKFRDFSLLFLKDGNIFSVLPGCLIEDNNHKIFASHQGSTYGGFIIPYRFGIRDCLRLVEDFIEFIKKKGIDYIWMRYPEYIFEKEPSQEIKFAMNYFGFKIEYMELSTCYDLSLYNENIPIIRQARKSYEKGIYCVFNDGNFKEFYRNLYKNLNEKYHREPTHTLEEILKLKKLLKDYLILISAYYNQIFIGGLLIFIANEKTAHIFYSTTKKNFKKGIFPNDALIDIAIREFKRRGFRFLNYGISTENNGKIINFNLIRFKEKFKGFGVYREIWGLIV